MKREELAELIRLHGVHQTWCYTCNKHVGRQADHLTDVLMPQGVAELRQIRDGRDITMKQFCDAYDRALLMHPDRAPGRTAINRELAREPYRSFNGKELGWYEKLMRENGFVRRGSRWHYAAQEA